MPAAAPIGTPRPPSLLKLIAQGSRGPAVKGDLAKAVRNLVREVTLTMILSVHWQTGLLIIAAAV